MSHTLHVPQALKYTVLLSSPVLVFRNRSLYRSVKHKLIYRTIIMYLSVTENID